MNRRSLLTAGPAAVGAVPVQAMAETLVQRAFREWQRLWDIAVDGSKPDAERALVGVPA